MKILLIHPYCLEPRAHEDNVSAIPMGLYYIGALLKAARYDVEILNFSSLQQSPQQIQAILREKRPDLIGFSVMNANRWGAVDMARMAKQIHPGVRIVFGGIAATFLWEHFLRNFSEVDYVVLGEGEYPLLDLVRTLEAKAPHRLHSIAGLAYREGQTIRKTAPAELIRDLDRLPIPAQYFSYQHVSLTRGCPGNCSFCGSPMFWGRRVRSHSADYFVRQLELLYQRGINFFLFSDDTFTLHKGRVIEICQKILQRRLSISWYAISRVDTIDAEVLYWMRKAGCIQISYGVESGSPEIRRRLNKNLSNARIRKTFALTTRYGILARAYLIYGCPGETSETIRETLELMREIKPLSVLFYVLRVFPGTALYSELQNRLQLTDDIWLERMEDLLYCEHDAQLSRESVLQYGRQLHHAFHAGLPDFVRALEFADDLEEFHPLYSDFCSRLAMTFSHGDFAQVDAVPDKTAVARELYEKSLAYAPDHRAYLGLGIIYQQQHAYRKSLDILGQGLAHHPHSELLHLCAAVSYMNLGLYSEALPLLLKFADSRQAAPHLAACYRALGDTAQEAIYRQKMQS